MRNINKLMLAFFFSSVIANAPIEASNVPGPMFSDGTPGSNIAQSSSAIQKSIDLNDLQIEANDIVESMVDENTSEASITPSSSTGQKTIDLNALDKSKKKKTYKYHHKKKKPTTKGPYSLGAWPSDEYHNQEWRDKAVLFLQKKGILDQNNVITDHGKLNSKSIKHIEDLTNRDTIDALRKEDPYAKWRKFSTYGIGCDFCKGLLEVHFYMDEVTNKLYLGRDYKVVDNYEEHPRSKTNYFNTPPYKQAKKAANKQVPIPHSEETVNTEMKQATAPKAKTAKKVVNKQVQIPISSETVNTEMQQTPAPKAKTPQNTENKQTLAHKPNTAHDAEKSPSPTVELTKLMLPDDITEIGELSYHNINEESVMIPFKIKSIRYGSFVNCKNLKKVRIYKADIGPGVFFNCPSIKDIDIKDGVKSIDNNSFSLKYEEVGGYGNYGPKFIRLPDSLVSIGNECFNNLNAVNKVSLGTNLTSIGYGFMAGNDHCRFFVKKGEGKERVKQLLINAGIPADRIND